MMLRQKLISKAEPLNGDAYWDLAIKACDEFEKKIAEEKIETTPDDLIAYTVAMTLIRKQLALGKKSDNPKESPNGVADKKKCKEESDELTQEAYPGTGMPEIRGVLTLLFVEQIQSAFLQLGNRYVANKETMYAATRPIFTLFAKGALEEKTKKAEALEALAQAFRKKNPAVATLADDFCAPKISKLTLEV